MERKELLPDRLEERRERTLAAHWEEDERCRGELLARLPPAGELDRRIEEKTRWLVERIRGREHPRWVDRLLARYPLSQKEGRLLLELAEALPRLPDDPTAD